MRGWFAVVLLFFLSSALDARAAACTQPWAMWEDFAEIHIHDGRVIDFEQDGASTSEGEAYALFFALVADDRQRFDAILEWTVNNLAEGDLANNLPAWKWGRQDGQWGVLDENSASDADAWMAYSLLLAADRWQVPKYEQMGLSMLDNIEALEVASLPGLGKVLLPGREGFQIKPHAWRLNPSYLPLQMARYFEQVTGHEVWGEIARSQVRMITSSPTAGVVPDWMVYKSKAGFSIDPESGRYSSYDAIRVYLWWAMLSGEDLEFESLKRFLSKSKGYAAGKPIPEKVHSATGKGSGVPPPGIVAAIAAYRKTMYARPAIIPSKLDSASGYYNQVLGLFAYGWLEGRYVFNRQGVVELRCQGRH
jgi:endoglucanase